MARVIKQKPNSEAVPFEPEAIRHFRQAILGGKHWYIALLEAIRLWDVPEETIDTRTYRYVIDGEALDYLLIAQRLCETVRNLVPEAEKTVLLFHGEPPLKLSTEEFRELIGRVKHHQYLNYFYGVTVEEALILAVEEEVRKERRLAGFATEGDVSTNEAYRRVYGSTGAVLLRNFRIERSYPQLKSAGLTELKEFTYWLFKYRLKNTDKARMASDTKKALLWLNRQGFARKLRKHDFETIVPQ